MGIAIFIIETTLKNLMCQSWSVLNEMAKGVGWEWCCFQVKGGMIQAINHTFK